MRKGDKETTQNIPFRQINISLTSMQVRRTSNDLVEAGGCIIPTNKQSFVSGKSSYDVSLKINM